MTAPRDDDFGQRARQLRVDTLIRLRWLAVAGQSAAVVLTGYGLGFDVPIGWCFLCIAFAVLLNLGLRLSFPVSRRLSDNEAAAILGFDILQLAALLYLTGGLINPFSILFLAPVMISAASLPLRKTFLLLALALVCATALAFWGRPLPWVKGEDLRLPVLYSVAIWAALAVGAVFIAIYANRVAEEGRQLAGALAATELVLAREQHLSQLDGLAAAAAHELGTPLATLTLVVTEMIRLGPPPGPFADDLSLLAQEVGRCRTILGQLASLGENGAGPLDELRISELIAEIVSPHRESGVAIAVQTDDGPLEPICRRNPGMIYGLRNIVENAVDFASHSVRVGAHWDRDEVKIVIADDGPGVPTQILARLGEPYVTTRQAGRSGRASGGGLGLGLFIAKTLLERSGAQTLIANAAPVGAVVTVVWTRASFEQGRRPRQEALEGGRTAAIAAK